MCMPLCMFCTLLKGPLHQRPSLAASLKVCMAITTADTQTALACGGQGCNPSMGVPCVAAALLL